MKRCSMVSAIAITLSLSATMSRAADAVDAPSANTTLKEFMKAYPLKPVRSYTFLGTENSGHEVWGTAKRYSKPTVRVDGAIDGWFNPGDQVPWVKDAMKAGAYEFGLVDGYLPAVHYVYRKALGDTVCEMTAFAADAGEPGSIFVHVALVEKEGGQVRSARYLKLGGSSPSSQAKFDGALSALRARWESFFARGKQIPIPDPDVMLACKASIVRSLITFTGKRPHYGVRSYGPGKVYGPDLGDGFPPTVISLVDCLLDWGQAELARDYLTAFFDALVRDDGRVRYYQTENVDGCSVAEYGQFLWLARRCMDAGGSRDWLNHIRPKLERIRESAWAAAEKHPSGMIPGCGEADLRTQVGIYFHNQGWMLRGLRDAAPLLGHNDEVQRCDAFKKTIQSAIERATVRSVTPMFIPPMLEKTPFNTMTPFKTMTENNFVSYTNYRYWPELLSSGILTREQMEAVIEYRKSRNGEIAGMGRIWQHADNWPIAEYAMGLRAMGRNDELRRVLFSHLAGHMTPETWTAYEQVAVTGSPFRLQKADYCVPAQLVAPRLAAWLYGSAAADRR